MVKINFNLLKSSEMYAYLRKFFSICSPATMEDGVLKSLAQQAVALFEKFAVGFERDSKDPLTNDIQEADQLRDRLFNGMKNYISSFQYHKDGAKVLAAEKLESLIRKHGWEASRMSYSSETTALSALLKEITTKYGAEIELLTASDWVTSLQEAQDHFDVLQMDRIESGTVDSPTLSEFRRPLTDAVKRLIATMEAHVLVTEDAELAEKINQVAELSDTTMALAKAQVTRKENQTAASSHPEESTN